MRIIQLALQSSHEIVYSVALVAAESLVVGMKPNDSPKFTKLGLQSLCSLIGQARVFKKTQSWKGSSQKKNMSF